MSEGQDCATQLRQLGVEPGAVRYVVQTHLHIDHTGALGHFPSASSSMTRQTATRSRLETPMTGDRRPPQL